MKLRIAVLCLLLTRTAAAETPLSFQISAAPTAVAIQFDVSATGAPITLGTPQFTGLSAHLIDSNVVGTGATRFVVYSPGNTPISGEGRITVSLSASGLPQNGMLSIGGVMASNSLGQQVAASPNALPIRTSSTSMYQSVQVGGTTVVSSDVIDPDGTVSSVTFKVAGASVGTVPGNSQALAYTPASPGLFALGVVATDSAGGESTLELGQLQAYRLADITSFQAFRDIHFNGITNPAVVGFGADPFDTGIPNGLAFVLGINPHSPDHSLLPTSAVEPDGAGGHRFVFRFARPSGISAFAWTVTESTGLSGWTVVPGGQIVQTALGDGFTEVLVRRPLPAAPGGTFFMQLEATE